MRKLAVLTSLVLGTALAGTAAAQSPAIHAPRAGINSYTPSAGGSTLSATNPYGVGQRRSAWIVASEQALDRGDVTGAFRALQPGVDAGDAVAMRAVGQLYLTGGEGVAPNREEAMRWFYEASLRGDAPSMYVLGRAFERGIGVQRDRELSRFWMGRAVSGGYRGS